MLSFEFMKENRKEEITMLRNTDAFKAWDGEKKIEPNLMQAAYDFLDPDCKADRPSKNMKCELTKVLRWMKTGREHTKKFYEADDLIAEREKDYEQMSEEELQWYVSKIERGLANLRKDLDRLHKESGL